LMIGDIAGKPGMRAVGRLLPRLVVDQRIDFTVANAENAAGGIGLTGELADELLALRIDCVTTGNHVWRQRELLGYIGQERRALRPYNFSARQPGRGVGLFETAAGIKVGVMNLVGRVFMDPADNPFEAALRGREELAAARVVLVDFHAEATSEKRAMGFHLHGRVTAVVGTHTHIQTADEQILEGGTAYITDVGMTGPHDSVIGIRKELALDKFVAGIPHPFKVAKHDVRLQGVVIRADIDTGRATSIERIDLPMPV